MTGMHFLDAQGPDQLRLYAIGDVHGRLDLLAAMHDAIAADLEQVTTERGLLIDWRIIHLGDYIDRGPDSKGVLEFLMAAGKRDGRNLFLAGNHDVGLLEFLAEPDPNGVFARHGGVQTAQSYGVELSTDRSGSIFFAANRLKAEHAALVAGIPRAHVEFLLSLSFTFEFGDFFFCHAGIRPGMPLDGQDPQDLIWIRDEFLGHPGLYDKVIVHGHTPVPEPVVRANRVDVDTYAWHSGRLTALVIDGTGKELLAVKDDGTVQRSEAVTP